MSRYQISRSLLAREKGVALSSAPAWASIPMCSERALPRQWQSCSLFRLRGTLDPVAAFLAAFELLNFAGLFLFEHSLHCQDTSRHRYFSTGWFKRASQLDYL